MMIRTINAPYVFQENYLVDNALFLCVFCITSRKPKQSATPATADPGWILARCCTDLTPCCCCFLPFLAPSAPMQSPLHFGAGSGIHQASWWAGPALQPCRKPTCFCWAFSHLNQAVLADRGADRHKHTGGTEQNHHFQRWVHPAHLGNVHNKPKPSMYWQTITVHVIFQQNSWNLKSKGMLKK